MLAFVEQSPDGSLQDAAPQSFGCLSAIPLLTITSVTTGDTRRAQKYVGRSCGGSRPHDSPGLWYAVVGTGAPMVASVCNSSVRNFDTQISVWTDAIDLSDKCSYLQCVTGNDDSCGLGSRGTWNSRAGQDYYIFVCEYLGIVVLEDCN